MLANVRLQLCNSHHLKTRHPETAEVSFIFIRNECSEIGMQLMAGMLVAASFSRGSAFEPEQRSETAGPEAVLLLGCTGWELACEPCFGQSPRGTVFPSVVQKHLASR